MSKRLELQAKLEEILGSRNVYFQPPKSVAIKYPCFRYSSTDLNVVDADNKNYLIHDQYNIIHICKDPDEAMEMQRIMLEEFDKIRFNRSYVSDNLYHNVYLLYY